MEALVQLDFSGDLRETKVTDAGMARFKDCKNLIVMALDRTQTSDAGLTPFKGIR